MAPIAEDRQPNESFTRRKRRDKPPPIRTTAPRPPPRRFNGRGHEGGNQGIMSWPRHNTGPPSEFFGTKNVVGGVIPPKSYPNSYPTTHLSNLSTSSTRPQALGDTPKRRSAIPIALKPIINPVEKMPVPPPNHPDSHIPASSRQEAPSSSISVKRERSSTPESLTIESRKLVTRGCKRYAPLPPECHRSHPNSKENRQAWREREQNALRCLGIKPLNAFIRHVARLIVYVVA